MTELQNQSAVRSARDVATAPELFETRDLSVSLRRIPSGRRCQPADQAERDHRVHRPVGLRQDHRAALLQPDERSHRRRPGRRHVAVPRRRPLRSRRSTPSRSAGASAWCSRSRTRSRRASTTTSPTARGCTGTKKQGRARRHRRAVAARRGAVGRGEGSAEDARRSACRAASSSGCASPVRSPSSRM